MGKYIRRLRPSSADMEAAAGRRRPVTRAVTAAAAAGRRKPAAAASASAAVKKPLSVRKPARAKKEEKLETQTDLDCASAETANFTATTSMGKTSIQCRATEVMLEEIEVFFAATEMQERKRFMDMYNFDVEKDAPFEGRYECVRLIPEATTSC